MSGQISRMQFLRGDLRGERLPVRPPWALAEAEFVQACERCDDCVRACPERILERGRGGFPQVDFARGGCTFCGDCVRACRPNALVDDGQRRPWGLLPVFGEACLSRRGIVCRVCGDACEATAIRFRLAVGGVALPEIDAARCTGCGECVGVCPEKVMLMTAEFGEP